MDGEQIEDIEPAEPWRCVHCNALIHNIVWIEGRAYPTEGAPSARYISEQYPRVCQMCFDLYKTLEERVYWRQLQSDKQDEIRRLKRD